MGITLSGAIQVYYDARPDLSIPAFWNTVCIWEFNKDYPLMQELGDGNRCSPFDTYNDWPKDSRYSDCLQVFTPQELPIHNSHRYEAMKLAVTALIAYHYKVRILFWRD